MYTLSPMGYLLVKDILIVQWQITYSLGHLTGDGSLRHPDLMQSLAMSQTVSAAILTSTSNWQIQVHWEQLCGCFHSGLSLS